MRNALQLLLGVALVIGIAILLLRSPAPPSPAERLRGDAASAYRWCDMGDSLVASGETEKAFYCFRHAVELGPNLPVVLMRAAEFHLGQNQSEAALRLTSKVLALAPNYDDVIFTYYDRLMPPDLDILPALAANRRASEAWLRHLLSINNVDEAQRTWKRLGERSYLSDALASAYLKFLIRNGLTERAADAWAAYLDGRRGDYRGPNALFNGSFELQPTGTDLDWQISPVNEVEAARVEEEARGGRWALRIRFPGSYNVAYSATRQMVVVREGTYRLRAWVRSKDLTTDQGVYLRIYDAEVPSRFVDHTEQIHGSNDWKLVEKTVVIPRATRVIMLVVSRDESRKFDNKISGTYWLDEVSLVPVAGTR